MNSKFTTIRFAISGAIVGACASFAFAATEVTLRERALLSSPVVKLGDVADISSENRAQAQRLSALPLMPSPTEGTQRFLRRREVEDLLSAHGIVLSGLRINGAKQVELVATQPGIKMNRHAAILAGHEDVAPLAKTKQAPSYDAEVITDGLRMLIADCLSRSAGSDVHWQVECDIAERHLAALATAKSRPICKGGTAPFTGRQRFVISFQSESGPIQIPVYAEVSRPATPIVVAKRPIARGEVFTAANVELLTVEVTARSNDRRIPLDSVDTVIGMEARQPVAAGAIVFSELVQSPVLVKRGELITVSSQSGGIRVRTTVKALADGSRGDLVQVESLETKEKFDARVVAARTAAVVSINSPEPARPLETARR